MYLYKFCADFTRTLRVYCVLFSYSQNTNRTLSSLTVVYRDKKLVLPTLWWSTFQFDKTAVLYVTRL